MRRCIDAPSTSQVPIADSLWRRFVVVACILLATPVFGEQAPGTDALKSRIHLLPASRNAAADGFQEDMVLSDLEEPLRETAKTKRFPRWKAFEDEQVSFRYPNHPDIRMEAKLPNEWIPILGQPVRSANYSFSKAYRLVLGKQTYALLMLEKADVFDDGICLCGAVAYQKYLFHQGSLCRFDFLEDGDLKRVQMLCNGWRLILFEWTHLPMSQEVYVDLTLGIRLKTGPCDEVALRKLVLDNYGFEGRLGFLEKGMSREDVVSLLGPPKTTVGSLLSYVQTKDRYQITTVIRLTDGVFTGFETGWQKAVRLPAERGSVDWIVETVDRDDGQGLKGEPAEHPLLPETVRYLFDRFVEIAPTAPGFEWNRLCRAMHGLQEEGLLDPRVLPIVRKRFAEPGIEQHFAAWILHKIDPEGSQDLFAKRIRLTLDEARKKTGPGKEKDEYLWPYGDIHNLLCFLEKKDPRRVPFILEGMDHPHANIRSDAYFFWDRVPAADAHPRLVSGLADRNIYVRRWASHAFSKTVGLVADVPLLKKRLSCETDQETVKNLETAIARLQVNKP